MRTLYTPNHAVKVDPAGGGDYYVIVTDTSGAQYGRGFGKKFKSYGPYNKHDAETVAQNIATDLRYRRNPMRRYRRRNPAKTSTETYVLAGLGVALVAGLGYYFYSQSQAASSASTSSGGGGGGGGASAGGGGGTSAQGSNVVTLGSGGSTSTLPATSGGGADGSEVDWSGLANQAIDAAGSQIPFAQAAQPGQPTT